MKVGDVVKATWTDGLVAIGRYSEKKQGFVILLNDEDRLIVCDPNNVKFEVINESR